MKVGRAGKKLIEFTGQNIRDKNYFVYYKLSAIHRIIKITPTESESDNPVSFALESIWLKFSNEAQMFFLSLERQNSMSSLNKDDIWR